MIFGRTSGSLSGTGTSVRHFSWVSAEERICFCPFPARREKSRRHLRSAQDANVKRHEKRLHQARPSMLHRHSKIFDESDECRDMDEKFWVELTLIPDQVPVAVVQLEVRQLRHFLAAPSTIWIVEERVQVFIKVSYLVIG